MPVDPTHLDPHHRATVDKILGHPTSSNIEWHAVLSMLESVGTVEERHDGKYVVTLGGETEVFDKPKHKDVDVEQVVDLRRMLHEAGFGTSATG